MNEAYQTIRCLGKGGMGEVRLVRDGIAGCDRAMKVLYDDADEMMKAAFQNEVRMLSLLHHPSIPRLIEEAYVQGRKAIVMEYIEGISLSKWIALRDAKQPDEACLLDWARQLLCILAYLHRQGIIYLDMKPENIILDGHNQLHLIDFGIARFIHETEIGCVDYGTVGFACLKQYQDALLDERCDIYAFGKTMIALCLHMKNGFALRHLCGSDTPLSLPFAQVLNRCVNEDIQLRYRDVTDVLDDLQAVDRILRKRKTRRLKRWGKRDDLFNGR